jgi:hypothetical protein
LPNKPTSLTSKKSFTSFLLAAELIHKKYGTFLIELHTKFKIFIQIGENLKISKCLKLFLSANAKILGLRRECEFK